MQSEGLKDSSLHWLTPVFLQNVVNTEGDDWKVTYIDKNTSQVVSKGDNYSSSMFRIKATLEKKGETRYLQLVVKTIPQDSSKEFAERIAAGNFFPTEIKMYNKIVPKLKEILGKAYPGEDTSLTPKFYHSLNSPPFNIVMEDLAPSGFVMGDRRKGLDLEQCELVMKTIARYHAATVALHDKDRQAVEGFDSHAFITDPKGGFFTLSGILFNVIATVVESWPENGKIYAEKLRKRSKTISSDISNVFKKENNQFCVLNHGDLWVNNIMFSYGAQNKITKVKLLDLQLSFYSSPALDLQYFMCTSPAEDVRVLHAEHLLQLYHAELCDGLRRAGAETHAPNYDNFVRDYENKSVYGLLISIFFLPLALADPNDANSNGDGKESVEFTIKAATQRFKNDSYLKILKHLLPDFVNKGGL